MRHALGLQFTQYKVYTSPKHGEGTEEKLSPADRKLIEEANQLDMKLYEYGVKLFNQQFNQMLEATKEEHRFICDYEETRICSLQKQEI